jgi:hypothetical protein
MVIKLCSYITADGSQANLIIESAYYGIVPGKFEKGCTLLHFCDTKEQFRPCINFIHAEFQACGEFR